MVTGLLGIGYEVLVVRVLSQVTENTVYTYATLLAVYLVGTAAGGAAYQRWLLAREQPDARDNLGGLLQAALAATCLLGPAILGTAEEAARKRVSRAVEKLRGYFNVKNGTAGSRALSATMLTYFLVNKLSIAAP